MPNLGECNLMGWFDGKGRSLTDRGLAEFTRHITHKIEVYSIKLFCHRKLYQQLAVAKHKEKDAGSKYQISLPKLLTHSERPN